jgi:hypothetical protein
VLGTVGSTLVVHLQGAIGALSVQRVGVIELKTGSVKVAPTLVATYTGHPTTSRCQGSS